MKGQILQEAALKMTPDDNVATVLDDLKEGFEFDVDGRSIRLKTDISFGHKVALTSISRGEKVYKYGEVIGQATQAISSGQWVHTHNSESTRGRGDLSPNVAEGENHS
jgi:altronate dehydratase small subunit